MDHGPLHERARERGVNPVAYWAVRAVFQPFFHVYLRMSRIGREHIPAKGPVILAANHRSFLDPWMIATMVSRPIYYVAKKELFAHRVLGWILNSLGAFPVDRGTGDAQMIETAKGILARGDVVVMFPEGTRTRPGTLGRPRRGVGRLALESGAPVVPVAIIGTEDVRRGWRIRPRKVRIRAGRPLRFPAVENASPALASAVTDRIWPCVMLQWEWLGGLPPIRRVAVIGAGAEGSSLAILLAGAGLEVDLGCRTHEQAAVLAETRTNESGARIPNSVRVGRASRLELQTHDLVCLTVPARALPGLMAAHGERIPRRAGVLVLSKGMVPPLGTLPSAFVSERCPTRAVAVAGGPAHGAEMLEHRGSVVFASPDRAFARQLTDVFTAVGLDVSITTDVTGVELAACAKNAAVLAAGAAAGGGPNVVGAAAGKVFAEVDALARLRGARRETLAGLSGTGDLIAAVVDPDSRTSLAGAMLARGVPAPEISAALGQDAEAIGDVPLLANAAHAAHLETPALDSLTALVEGRLEPERWMAMVTMPHGQRPAHPVRAA